MKTTLDLPDDLFKEVKMRSVRDGRKFKETVADLLRAALDQPARRAGETRTLPRTLPVAPLRRTASPVPPTVSAEEWCQALKEAELEQDVERYEKTA